MRQIARWIVLSAGLLGCSQGAAPEPAALPLLSISQPPDPEVRAAVALLERGERDQALQRLSQFLAKQPNNAAAYDARATVYQQLGMIHQAVNDLNRAVELSPDDARLYNNRGFLRLARQEFAAALEDFENANRIAPQYANAYNNRGLVEIAQNKHRQAIVNLDQALSIDPNYVDAYNNRGFASFQLGRFDRALADFNTALRLNPKYVNALNNRGLLKQRLGDVAGAIADFTEAMMIDPRNPKYYQHRRDAYIVQGDHQGARADEQKIVFLLRVQELTTAIETKPTAELFATRAELYVAQGDDVHAADDYHRALQLNGDHMTARLGRARLRLAAKSYEEAQADCEAILSKEPHPGAFSVRGDCRLALHDLDGALEDFAQARRLDDAVAEAYHRKGESLLRQGDSTAAQAWLDRAESLRSMIREQSQSAEEGRQAAEFPAESATESSSTESTETPPSATLTTVPEN